MGSVRVRAEQAIVGLGWHEVAEVERTPFVDNAIEGGRLVVVDENDNPLEEVLRGDALDQALKNAGLSTSGKADEKRARLAAHRSGEPAGDEEEGARDLRRPETFTPGSPPTAGAVTGGSTTGTRPTAPAAGDTSSTVGGTGTAGTGTTPTTGTGTTSGDTSSTPGP